MAVEKGVEFMITTVYFVRHAHSDYTPDERNRPLSIKGEKDAERVKHLLKDDPIDVFWSSPYRRAIQTIEPLARLKHQAIHIEERLRERTLAQGGVEDFSAAITRVWEDEKYKFPGGESNDEARHRGGEVLKRLLIQHPGESIVIGTHGNIMTLMLQYFHPAFDLSFWKELCMPDVYKVEFDQTDLLKRERVSAK